MQKKILVDDLIYNLYNGTSNNGSVQWPTFTFISQSHSITSENVNILAFIREASKLNPTIKMLTVAALQAGFRFYTGQSLMQFNRMVFFLSNDTSVTIEDL